MAMGPYWGTARDFPVPDTTTVGSEGDGFGNTVRIVSEGERERKHRTWYSAAAERLPEMDWSMLRNEDASPNLDEIPRYRDEEKRGRREEGDGKMDKGGDEEEWERREGSDTKTDEGMHEEKRESRGTRDDEGKDKERPPVGGEKKSARSSWGLRRDTWNLMPSVIFWNRESLVG